MGRWSILRALIDGPRRADALIQRAVNAGMFAAMRAGASKGLLRYGINGGLTLSLVAVCWADAQVEGWRDPLIIAGICVPGYLWVQRAQQRADETEEAVGIPARTTATADRWLWWLFLLLDMMRAGGFVHPFSSYLGHPGEWTKHNVASLAFDVLILLRCYSAATPPRPPSREPKRVLVPAEARQ